MYTGITEKVEVQWEPCGGKEGHCEWACIRNMGASMVEMTSSVSMWGEVDLGNS